MIALIAGVLTAGAVGAQTNPTQAFAHPAFQRVWTRTDLLVQQGQVGRSWYWGPQPRTATQEQWLEAPGGQRLVQYFDKSRMEINDPNADPNSLFFVTNGLLTVELISGNMQIGTSAYSPRTPACINISGDSDDPTAPTYYSFRSVASVAPGLGRSDPDKRGQAALTTIDRAGNIGLDAGKSGVPGVTYAYYETTTHHNIPQIFWDFLNQTGAVIENGQTVQRALNVPWFYASGLPVSDAYWARVKIAGLYQDVLIQAFERRVLTYNPNNQPAFQVEMGNIGLHYYDWRYNNIGTCPQFMTPVATSTVGTPAPAATSTRTATPAPPTATATATPGIPGATQTPVPLTGKIVFVSNRSSKRDVWIMNADGTAQVNLTQGLEGDNYDAALSPDGTRVVFVASQDGNPEIYAMNANGSLRTRLTMNTNGDFHPTWSPDGSKIAFVTDRTGNNEIFVMNANGSNQINMSIMAGDDRDPNWGSNDRIAFVSNRTGDDEIYSMKSDGTNVLQLTNSSGPDWLPSWSPSATRLLFVSGRDSGNLEIYVMKADGANPTRLTTLLSNEYDPAWSPDEKYMAYSSNRGGDIDIYVSYLDGSFLRQLTTNAGDDVRPSWR
jgi:Tol biopolymer transport system component